MRPPNAQPDALRPVSLQRNVARYAEGSCLVKFGETHVLCTASLEDKPPMWLRGQGKGWITAEYSMLPRATHTRTRRESTSGKQSGRTQEIQRLIGRSLRAVTNLQAMGERQITVDCDVLQADGGTRTAAITGAWVALHDCLKWMRGRSMIKDMPLKDHVAAVSCGIYKETPVLDLDYLEDSPPRPTPISSSPARAAWSKCRRLLKARCFRKPNSAHCWRWRGAASAISSACRSWRSRNDAAQGRKLVIATHNAGKLREMRELVAPYGVEAVSAGELGLAEPDETGADFIANALIKARPAALGAGLPALADDSGLVLRCARWRAGHLFGALGGRLAKISPPP